MEEQSLIQTIFHSENTGLELCYARNCIGKVQGYQLLNTSKKTQNQKKAVFGVILKVELPSLNLIFSGSKGQNVKISVSIRKKIACRF